MRYPKRYPIMHGYQDSFILDINDYFKWGWHGRGRVWYGSVRWVG